MKRTPLRRHTELVRRAWMNKVNPKRKRRLREHQFGDKAEWMRQLNCCACGELGADPHHVRSRGAGGTQADMIPLCRRCHVEVHTLGKKSFAAKWGINLRGKAEMYHEWWARGRATGEYELGF